MDLVFYLLANCGSRRRHIEIREDPGDEFTRTCALFCEETRTVARHPNPAPRPTPPAPLSQPFLSSIFLILSFYLLTYE